jgi:hypothetical protein
MSTCCECEKVRDILYRAIDVKNELTRRGGLRVPSAVEPRELFGAHGFKFGDGVALLHGETDVVQAVNQAVLAEFVNVEGNLFAVGADDDLVG